MSELSPHDQELLKKIMFEYHKLIVEMELADRYERNRVAIEISQSLKRDGVTKGFETRLRRKAAREITARMMSVGEAILGL